jgi:hypothetical protein
MKDVKKINVRKRITRVFVGEVDHPGNMRGVLIFFIQVFAKLNIVLNHTSVEIVPMLNFDLLPLQIK